MSSCSSSAEEDSYSDYGLQYSDETTGDLRFQAQQGLGYLAQAPPTQRQRRPLTRPRSFNHPCKGVQMLAIRKVPRKRESFAVALCQSLAGHFDDGSSPPPCLKATFSTSRSDADAEPPSAENELGLQTLPSVKPRAGGDQTRFLCTKYTRSGVKYVDVLRSRLQTHK